MESSWHINTTAIIQREEIVGCRVNHLSPIPSSVNLGTFYRYNLPLTCWFQRLTKKMEDDRWCINLDSRPVNLVIRCVTENRKEDERITG